MVDEIPFNHGPFFGDIWILRVASIELNFSETDLMSIYLELPANPSQ